MLKSFVEMLESESGLSRTRAARALGKIGDVRAVEPLVKALKNDKNEWVRGAAAEALGQIGDEWAVDPLIEALEEDKDGFVRASAAEALGRIGDERAVEPLIRALEGGSLKAAEALGKIGDERAIEPLIRAFSVHYLDDERWIVVKALAAFGKPAVERLIKALKDEDWLVRDGAATALGEIGDERAVQPLVELFKSGRVGRGAAAWALRRIGGERVVKALTEALMGEDEWVRRIAELILEKTGA